MVGPGAVVAQRDRRPGADEDRAGVADPGGASAAASLGLDLEVLGGVGVDDLEPLLEVVDQHDGRLPAAQRGADPLGVAGRGDLLVELGLDLVGEPLASRDQDAGGHRVVLGLADQVGGDVRRVGRVVGEDRDLGRPGLGVDPDDALEQPLGRDGVDVAGSGHQVDAAARAGAVGEHGDRLGAADGVHLVDAQQRAGRQDGRVRQPVVVLLRRLTRARWSATPATWAGTTFITTLETSGAMPPGT